MAPTKAAFGLATRTIAACAALVVGGGLAFPASAQKFPITPAQRATAQQVAQAGVPLSELAPDAPDSYTVKRGDTLWDISGKFLKSPWRWPELWGMNLDDIKNPHLIYPGQVLYLEKVDGMARLRTSPPGSAEGGVPVVRVSPRTRVSGVADNAIPAIPQHLIEAFLNESIIVDDASILENAPRIVGTTEDKVLIGAGDRAYARGRLAPFVEEDPPAENYRVFRNAEPLLDPNTGAVLGYEAKFLGTAELVRSEGTGRVASAAAGAANAIIPATIDIKRAKLEIWVGDRLLPAPPRAIGSYVPHPPRLPIDAAIISVYGDAVELAGQSSIVALSAGMIDGVDVGTVMAIQKAGRVFRDRSDGGDLRNIQLPDERAGMLMVFRTFDHLSYALILEVNQQVRIGDRVTDPH
jgi:hypothetical protein